MGSLTLLSVPREVRDLILEYAISTREVTFGRISAAKYAPQKHSILSLDMLDPKCPQNEIPVAIPRMRRLNTTSNRPTRRAPTTAEIRASMRGSGLGLLTTCHQLHHETVQLLYSSRCTTFRFWSIHELLSFLHRVGDNAAYVREAFLRIELKWDDRFASRKPRLHMQLLLGEAAALLTGLRYLDLRIWMDHLECIPGNWSERKPSNSRAPIGLQEMFSPLESIATLDHVNVKIQTSGVFQSAAVKGEILAITQRWQDGLNRSLNGRNGEREPLNQEQMSSTIDVPSHDEDYEDCALLSRTSSTVSKTSEGDDDNWTACCAQQ